MSHKSQRPTIIEDMQAREVLDSRGNPTVEVAVLLMGGSAWCRGRALRGLNWSA